MQGQKALIFHQKYLNLCSEDERRSYGFGTTWGWVINDRIFIFGWTILLRPVNTKDVNYNDNNKVLIIILFPWEWRLPHHSYKSNDTEDWYSWNHSQIFSSQLMNDKNIIHANQYALLVKSLSLLSTANQNTTTLRWNGAFLCIGVDANIVTFIIIVLVVNGRLHSKEVTLQTQCDVMDMMWH